MSRSERPKAEGMGAAAAMLIGVGLLMTLAGLIYLLVSYPSLPEVIPTHFGIHGEPDAWGPRGSLIGLGLVWLLLSVLVAGLARYPHVANYPVEVTGQNAARLYRIASQLLGTTLLGVSALMWGILRLTVTGTSQTPLFVIGLVLLFGGIIVGLVRMVRAR
ncbi:MAG: DUF1648 domain-containing protein [Pseudoclavibacter sp.]